MVSFTAPSMYYKSAQHPQGAIPFVSLNLTRTHSYFLSRLLPVLHQHIAIPYRTVCICSLRSKSVRNFYFLLRNLLAKIEDFFAIELAIENAYFNFNSTLYKIDVRLQAYRFIVNQAIVSNVVLQQNV